MIVLGIDPGAKETGMVLLDVSRGGPRLLWSDTVRRVRYATALPVPDEYLNAIHTAAAAHPADVVAVEGIVAPNKHMERAFYQSSPLLATALVAGHCRGLFAAAGVATVLVPPGDNGRAVLGAYPPELVSKRERQNPDWRVSVGGDHATLRHVRSAFDVARTGGRMVVARGVRHAFAQRGNPTA